MLPWVSMAPLETPVVPPVYCRKAMSSWVSGGSTSLRRAPCASADLKLVVPGMFHAGTSFFLCLTT